MRRGWSLSTLLIFRLLSITILLVGAITWLAYEDIKHEARELFDAQLAQSARLMLSLIQADHKAGALLSIQNFLDENRLDITPPRFGEHQHGEQELPSGHIYETKLGFQIWDAAGNLVTRSPNAPITPLSLSSHGYSYRTLDGAEWRVFTLTSKDRLYRCMTAERIDVRNDLISRVSADLQLLSISMILSLIVTIWLGTKQGLKHLRRLASRIGDRDPRNLDDLPLEDDPAEVTTIATQTNKLLGKLREALQRERQITNDAAHELRTPLAVIKLYTELAERAENPEDRNRALGNIHQGITRTSHLVEQLLTLARLEPELMQSQFERCDLGIICADEASILTTIADDKDIELVVGADAGEHYIVAEPTSLRLLIKNLLHNAISYTQAGGRVAIKIRGDDDGTSIIVSDNGPGVPAEKRDMVLRRFATLSDRDEPGCGIGLSIVQRVCELHGARLELSDSDGGGLTITASFPPATTV